MSRYLCSHSPGMDRFAHAIEVLQSGAVDVAPIFTHRLPFAEFPEAFALASEYRDGVIKTLLTFDD